VDFFPKLMDLVKSELTSSYKMTDTSAYSDSELLLFRLNLNEKLVQPKPRLIIKSDKIDSKRVTIPTEFQNAFNVLEGKISNGHDINPFLSKMAINPKLDDHLLYDWKIHHFHLNDLNDGTSYFNERSDYLLLAIVEDDSVFFIDIEHHSDPEVFVKQEYIKIILDNWPHKMERYEIKGISVGPEYSNDEIKKLRKAGIQTCVVIADKAYAPIGGGLTAAGTSVKQSLKATQIQKTMRRLSKWYENNKQPLLDSLKQVPGFDESKLNFEFGYANNERLALFEFQTGVLICCLDSI